MRTSEAAESKAEVPTAHRPEPAVEPGSGAERLLALQRSAGNAAVSRMLARQQPATAPIPGAEPAGAPGRVEVTDLRYVCVFVGPDLYGTQARRFARFAMPEHHLVEASSMEDALLKMRRHAQGKERGGKRAVRVAEIVLIAHGAPGKIRMPLLRGQSGDTTVESFIALQGAFRQGESGGLQADRNYLLSLIDERTDVIVRGCRVGRVRELVDALTAFFGGQATVYVPTQFQGYTRLRIGGPTIKDAEAAYDFLVAKGFIPYGLAYTRQEKERWVAKNLADGYVPEMWLATDENVTQIRGKGGDDPEIQALKDYAGAQLQGLEHWAIGRGPSAGADDPELDQLSADEIVAIARARLAELRELERSSPGDWRAIGEKAWWVMRCHHAWGRKPEAHAIDPANKDPIGGLWMPGLAYDTNLLSMQAARRPDLRIGHSDLFLSAELRRPPSEAVGEIEDPSIREGPTPTPPAQGRPAKPPGDGLVVLPEDTITPGPGPAELPPVSLDLEPGEGKQPGTPPVGGAIRPVNFKRKFPLPVKAGSPDSYFELRGAEISLEGYMEWGVKGEQEVAIGQLFSFEPGKPYSAGVKGEAKLAEKKWESGWYAKWKGGFESTEVQHGSGQSKWEISTAIEWGNGHYVGELKVFCSYDSAKGELRAGGVKFSPAGIQGEFPIPLADGSRVNFKGKALLSADVQPNWPKIASRLGLRFAGTAAAAGGTAVAGGGIATGLAAVGAAEAAALGVAAAGIAITLYASYRSIKDWTDIKSILPVAQQASADFRAGFVSAFGVPAKGQGPMFAKGAAVGATMSRKMGERMVEGYKAKTGQPAPFTVADAEQFTRDEIAASPALAGSLRGYAYGAFHKWIMAEFYRQWVSRHKGEWTQPKNDKYTRTYLGLPLSGEPKQPDWTYVPKPEPQVIEEPF